MSTVQREDRAESRSRIVALIGNPNTGKTTIFNRLTGLNLRTGNYPGVTVEKKLGRLKGHEGTGLLDLPGASDCCGAAGICNLVQPEMSERLKQRKLDAIRQTRPDAVATGNPGCLLQLGSAVRDAGLGVEVVHPVELLARAYS